MQLIGMIDSPYVRRVAISAKYLGLDLEYRPLSVFNDLEEFRTANPLIKAPTLVCDEGSILVDSTLIIEYFTTLSTNGYRLVPEGDSQLRKTLHITGVALVAIEKIVQITYESLRRPLETMHEPWLDRLLEQLHCALSQLDQTAKSNPGWLVSDAITQADITTAVAWRVTQFIISQHVQPEQYPDLAEYSKRVEALPEFMAFPLSSN
jgi:glutathione S-transferase